MVNTSNTQGSAVAPKVVIGQIQKLLFRGKGIAVALLSTPGEKWVAPPKSYLFKKGFDLKEGEHYRCVGRLILTTKRGFQFHVERYTALKEGPSKKVLSDHERLNIIAALLAGNVPGVGSKTAQRLHQAFGDELLVMTSPEPLQTLSGIGERKAFMILANLRRFIDELNI